MNIQLIFFAVVIVAIVLMMFRNGRKRQRDQQALASGLQPGAEIMTTFGVFGTIESVDDEANKIVLVTGPGSTLTIHRQAVGKIIPPADETGDTQHVPVQGAVLNGEPIAIEQPVGEPEFGERVQAPTVPSGADDDAPKGRKA